MCLAVLGTPLATGTVRVGEALRSMFLTLVKTAASPDMSAADIDDALSVVIDECTQLPMTGAFMPPDLAVSVATPALVACATRAPANGNCPRPAAPAVPPTVDPEAVPPGDGAPPPGRTMCRKAADCCARAHEWDPANPGADRSPTA